MTARFEYGPRGLHAFEIQSPDGECVAIIGGQIALELDRIENETWLRNQLSDSQREARRATLLRQREDAEAWAQRIVDALNREAQ